MLRVSSYVSLKPWGSGLCLKWKRTVHLLPGIHGQNGITPPKVLDPKIARTQKLPLQTGLADLAFLKANSHLPSKHCGCVLSFLWKSTGLLLWAKRAEIVIPHSKFQISKSCSKTNLPGQTSLSGLGLWWLPLTAPETLGLCGFLPVETMVTLWGLVAPRTSLWHFWAAWFQGPSVKQQGFVEPRGHHCITGPRAPKGRGDPAGHRGSMETIVALQGPMESWRPL